ncbi:hypothetical protein [Phytohabitans houttuyneae]|uniref:Thioredoxin domain-containing protein n=1 Tax=Phytohabitans houttuyneae TaxID=1076126 RepID=A0A6V8KER8_9ACTN|nr:hypothetical protein [Phytohabitans houttuyneae]GFJ80838.1 hypothetical protein Phou_050180 [Phytohabitans houttuyneae]
MTWLVLAGLLTVLILTLLNLSLTAALIRYVRERDAADTHHRPPAFATGQRVGSFQAWTVAGDAVSEQDLDGGDSLVAFVSAGCPPCQDVLAQLETGVPLPERRLFVFVFGDDADAASVAARLPRAVVARTEVAGQVGDAFGGVEGYPRLMLVSDAVVTAVGLTLEQVVQAAALPVPTGSHA